MELIPEDGTCIVNVDGTIVWVDAIFSDWFSHRGIMPGMKISQLFPGIKELCRPGALFEDTGRFGKKRYFEAECKPTYGVNGEKVSDVVRLRNVTFQKTLVDISRQTTQVHTPKELFEKILWIMRDTFQYLAFAGYVVRDGNVQLVASKGWTEKLKSIVAVQPIAPDSPSMAGRTAYHRQQMVMAMKDYGLSQATKAAIERMGGEYIVVTPLVDQDRLVGVLTVIHDRILTPVDFETLQAICGQIAVALNATLQKEEFTVKADDAVLYVDLLSHLAHENDMIVKAGIERPELNKYAASAIGLNESLIASIRAFSDGAPQNGIELGSALKRATTAAEDLAAVAGKKLSLKQAGDAHIIVGPLLQYALNEVLNNSVKYATSLEVDVEVRVVKERSGMNRIEISDNGPGIPDEFKSEVFRRPKSPRMNNPSGIGLYLVKKIANKYGGRVWIEDRVAGNPAKGTKVVITLPAYTAKS